MHTLRFLFTSLLTALFLTGCVAPLSEGNEGQGTGDLTLSVNASTVDLQTKANNQFDGSAFRNLLVVLVNGSNTVKAMKRVPETGSWIEPVTSTSVSFTQLAAGDYTVYAFANVDHLDWFAYGSTLSSIVLDNPMPNNFLLEVPDGGLAYPTNKGMLLSGKTSVTIDGNPGLAHNITLYRPVVRFNVLVDNNTEFPVTLKDLSFSAFNASTTQLIDPRTSTSDKPLPPVQTYGSLPAYAKSSKTIEHNSQMNVYSQLLFENAASVEYRMYASLEMNTGTEIHSVDIGTPTPVLIKTSAILDMQTGDSLRVMMVNPQKSSNNGRLIGYESNKFVQQTKNTSGVTASDFQQWLKTILANPALKKSYVLNLKKTGDNAYQLLDRKRNNLFSHILVYNTTDKLENGGIMQGLDPAPATSLTSNFDESFINDAEPVLMRFRYPSDVSNKPYYMWYRKDNGYSEGFWVYKDGNQNHGTRQFAFYQIKADGSPLRTIDENTGRIDPLTCMPRNTDITVVLSVYYNGDGQAEVSYEVKGWVNTAEASHTFGIWTGMDGTN